LLSFATLKSIGAYTPDRKLTNLDLERIVDTTDEWIVKRTGISTRHIASENETTSDLALKAAQLAISRARIEASDVDMIICATITPDYFCMPSTACVIADKLGIKDVPAFDISAACSGFIYALTIAKSFVESGAKKNILIIGAETLSKIIDYTDRTTCVLFGDGAGAAIIGSTDDEKLKIIDANISSDGEYKEFLQTTMRMPNGPESHCDTAAKIDFLQMKGNETFKVAVRTLTNDVVELLEKNKIAKEQIKFFVPHQANLRIISAVGDAIGLEKEQVVLTVAKYGNTSAASIPMAINDIYEDGKLKKGDLMLLDAFGGGLTWGSALLHFGGN
jgi:3-oxoacyl-[acyl-carrier-protein] synthase III